MLKQIIEAVRIRYRRERSLPTEADWKVFLLYDVEQVLADHDPWQGLVKGPLAGTLEGMPVYDPLTRDGETFRFDGQGHACEASAPPGFDTQAPALRYRSASGQTLSVARIQPILVLSAEEERQVQAMRAAKATVDADGWTRDTLALFLDAFLPYQRWYSTVWVPKRHLRMDVARSMENSTDELERIGRQAGMEMLEADLSQASPKEVWKALSQPFRAIFAEIKENVRPTFAKGRLLQVELLMAEADCVTSSMWNYLLQHGEQVDKRQIFRRGFWPMLRSFL